MDEPSADVPGFDEYVAARGSDLLRTAWLLTGDGRAAEELVRTALVRALPQWRHIAVREAGHDDLDVLRTMASVHTAGRRGAGRDGASPSPARAGAAGPGEPGRDPLRQEVLTALAGLSRLRRAVVVLRYFVDLGEGQVADVLDRSPGTVRAQCTRALAALPPTLVAPGSGPFDPQWRLRDALARAAPSAPDVDGLAEDARALAGRARRRRRTAAASVTLGALAVVATLALAGGQRLPLRPHPDPTSTPSTSVQSLSPGLAFQSCQQPTIPLAEVSRDSRPVSERYDAVLVCARTDVDSVWTGSLPPDDVVAASKALDLLRIAPRDSGAGCPPLPSGPAFRLLVRSRTGSLAYLPNESLRCSGWELLAAYYVAVAEQRGEPAPDRLDGSYLSCPPLWTTPSVQPLRALPRGTTLRTATICLHPLPESPLRQVPRMRPMRGTVLGEVQVEPLDADLARHGTAPASGRPCPQRAWRYVLRAVTGEGRLVELAGGCPEELTVVGAPGTTMRFGPDAAALLRGSVLGS